MSERKNSSDPNVQRARENAQKYIAEHPNVPVVDVPEVGDERCGYIFDWGDPAKDCRLPFRHEGPHEPPSDVGGTQ